MLCRVFASDRPHFQRGNPCESDSTAELRPCGYGFRHAGDAGHGGAGPGSARPSWRRLPAVPTRPRRETATNNVLALNTGMFELYGDAARVFKRNILSKHPVILGLFSGAGGRFILYRPGQPPLDAPSVPVVYQLLKSVGHSTMALTQVVGPYLDNPADQSWRGTHARLSQPDEIGARWPRPDADAGGVARQQSHHPGEQHRIHGRLRGEGRHLLRRAWRHSPRSRALT